MADTPATPEQRKRALTDISYAEALQDHRWQAVHDTVELAGDTVTTTRLAVLEDSKADEGSPLWLGVLIAGVAGAVPSLVVGSILSSLIVCSRNILGRVGVDKGAVRILERANLVERDFRISSRDVASVRRALLANDSKTLQLTAAATPGAENALENAIEAILSSGENPRRLKPAAGQSESRSRVPEPAQVTVKRSLYEWIRLTRWAEKLALLQIREMVVDDKSMTMKDIGQLIDGLTQVTPVGFDDQSGGVVQPDVLLLFQQYIEKCMWCTTYDFRPEYTGLAKVPLPPGYSSRFWTILTKHFIEDPTTGTSFYDFRPKAESPMLQKFRRYHAEVDEVEAAQLRLAEHLETLRSQIVPAQLDFAAALDKVLKKASADAAQLRKERERAARRLGEMLLPWGAGGS